MRVLLMCVVVLSLALAIVSEAMSFRSRFATDTWNVGHYAFKSNPGKLRVWEVSETGSAHVLIEIPYHLVALVTFSIALTATWSLLTKQRRRDA
jgi:hypothetical protein